MDGAVIGIDSGTDLAVVRVDPKAVDLVILPLGDSDGLEVGDTVYSVGNGLDYDFSMTEGIVSALHRVLLGPNDALIRDGIQTDAAVNVGDSGGPLLDARGAVVGVNEQIATPGGVPTGNVGLAFAVPVDTVRDVLHQLRTTGTVVRPWIGVEALTITPAAVQLLGLESDRGILLVGVTPDGPAASAGLRGGDRVVSVPGSAGRTVTAGGDVITAMDGRPMASTDDLVDRVQALRPGDVLRRQLPPRWPGPPGGHHRRVAAGAAVRPRPSASRSRGISLGQVRSEEPVGALWGHGTRGTP